MNKFLRMCIAGVSGLMGLTGCAGASAEAATVATQSSEYAKAFKVLMVGQSLAQDTVWFLQQVMKSQMPDKEFLVADIYQSIGLGDHRENILNNASIYHYYKFHNNGFEHMKGATILHALKDEEWDLIIFNDTTYAATQPREFEDGDHAFMINYIRENAKPGFKLAYNATWANPTNAELWNDKSRLQPPTIVHERFAREFGGSRNVYFDRVCSNIKKYIESNEEYDLVFHPGTAIQYASETFGVPEMDPMSKYDLYRDYVHLSDFGRLIVAHQMYAQIFGLTKLESVNVDLIKAHMRTTAREQNFGDLEITQQHKDAIIASVNYALVNPNKAPEQKVREPAILERPDLLSAQS